MPLPIEVNYVLGKRTVTLEPREVESPITVGRARECDVQIPSATIEPTHCMLFVHERQWLLQESPGAVVTVNGKPIAGPVALQIGDVIAIGNGAKAPSITVAPAIAAAGKTGPARESKSAAAQSVIRPPQPRPVVDEAPPQLAPEPQAEHYDHGEEAGHEPEADGGDHIDLGTAAMSTTSTFRRRPKRNSGIGGMVAVAVVLLGGVGALIYWAINAANKNRDDNQVPPPPPVAVWTQPPPPATRPMIDDGPVVPKSIFDVPGSKTKAPPPVTPAPTDDTPAVATPTTMPPGDQTGNTAADDDIDDDPDWLAVLTAHSRPDYGSAIMKYDSYSQAFPDNKHKAELVQFENEAMERLWWQRIDQLYKTRADFEKQMADKRADITDQPAGEFHNKLVAELKAMKEQRDIADQELTVDYGYTLPAEPDIDDRALTASLDAKRDPDTFATWKKKTITWIRKHDGKPPWTDE